MVRVKICGVTTVDDAVAACDAGAHAIGLNFLATSPRAVTLERALEIREVVAPFVQVVGVFVNAAAGVIREACAAGCVDLVQLHGAETPEFAKELGIKPLRAIRVRSEADLAPLPAWERVARAIVLDGAGLAGAFGGASFDWSLVKAARALTSRPLVLAGGLSPENVASAIRAVRPAGVDVASGVESAPGRKDPLLMRAFVRAAQADDDGLP
jgi:phosphoribosylanthranilate isomerase